MYAIVLDEHLDEHVAWLDEHYADGTFLASGRREPRTGGVILTVDLPPEQIQALAGSDPFSIHGLATHTLVRFHPSKLAEPLAGHAKLLA